VRRARFTKASLPVRYGGSFSSVQSNCLEWDGPPFSWVSDIDIIDVPFIEGRVCATKDELTTGVDCGGVVCAVNISVREDVSLS
jgi:hypothetical protein